VECFGVDAAGRFSGNGYSNSKKRQMMPDPAQFLPNAKVMLVELAGNIYSILPIIYSL